MKIDDLSGNYIIVSGDIEDIELEVVDTIEYDNKTYVCVLPVDEPECEKIFIWNKREKGEEIEYWGLDDNNLASAIYSEFKRRNKDSFIFMD